LRCLNPIPRHDHQLQDLAITLRHTRFGRTPLHEWPTGRRELYLTTHNIQKKQISMPPSAFEPTNPANEWSHTHALDIAATGTYLIIYY